jgi:hypothetical protein
MIGWRRAECASVGRSAESLDGLIRWATDVLLEPDGQFGSAETTGGQVEHETLLLIDGGMDLTAVDQKKVAIEA